MTSVSHDHDREVHVAATLRRYPVRTARWGLTAAVVASIVGLTACDSSNSRRDVMAPSPAELLEVAHFRAGAGAVFDGDSIFYHRAYAGRILEDGSVAIATLGSDARVILLDSLGEASAVVGRQGRGPGEFLAPSLLYPLGRSLIAAFDLGNRRISLVTEDGIVGEINASGLPARHEVIGFVDDSLAVSAAHEMAGADSPGAPSTYQVWRSTSAGLEAHRAFAGPPEPPSAIFELSNPTGPDMTMWEGSGCLPEIQHVAGPSGVWVGDASTGVLTLFDEFGERRAQFRDTTAPILSRAARDGLEARIAETERSMRATYTSESKRAALAALGDVGEPLPSYWSDILLDDEGGGVWLEVAMCNWEDRDRTWIRVDTAGRKTGTVAVPAALRLLAVRGSLVLAVATDSLGIESPKLFRVTEPSRTPS